MPGFVQNIGDFLPIEFVFSFESLLFLVLHALLTNVFLLLHLLWNCPGEAKVTDLDAALVSEEHVAWLEVAVEYIGGVEEIDCAQKVV